MLVNIKLSVISFGLRVCDNVNWIKLRINKEFNYIIYVEFLKFYLKRMK